MSKTELETEILKYISSNAKLISLLYDIDLIPEQLKKDSKNWFRMLMIGEYFREQSNKLRIIPTESPDFSLVAGGKYKICYPGHFDYDKFFGDAIYRGELKEDIEKQETLYSFNVETQHAPAHFTKQDIIGKYE